MKTNCHQIVDKWRIEQRTQRHTLDSNSDQRRGDD